TPSNKQNKIMNNNTNKGDEQAVMIEGHFMIKKGVRRVALRNLTIKRNTERFNIGDSGELEKVIIDGCRFQSMLNHEEQQEGFGIISNFWHSLIVFLGT